jgi:hypothetical protein
MALTYDQQGALQTNLPFGLRVQVAVVGFANYIENEGPSVPQHNARLRFAGRVYDSAGPIARQIQVLVVAEQGIIDADIDATDGDSTADDATVQTAVETVANRLI